MSTFEPTFSQRRSGQQPSRTDLPDHVLPEVANWVEAVGDHVMRETRGSRFWFVDVGLRAQQHIYLGNDASYALVEAGGRWLVEHFKRLKSVAARLDLLDAILSAKPSPSDDLRGYLSVLLDRGGSMWTVAPDGGGLTELVVAEVQELGQAAMYPQDEASEHLAEAWQAAYGRATNAPDAWDHAIKALEALLKPLVIPGQPKGNLGGVIGELRANPHVWEFALEGTEATGRPPRDSKAVADMLELVWADPGRHGGTAATLEQARKVVVLGATVVQWIREGAITRR